MPVPTTRYRALSSHSHIPNVPVVAYSHLPHAFLSTEWYNGGEVRGVYNSCKRRRLAKGKKEDRVDLIVYGGEIILRKKAATAMPRERFNYLSPGSQARDSTVFVFLL